MSLKLLTFNLRLLTRASRGFTPTPIVALLHFFKKVFVVIYKFARGLTVIKCDSGTEKLRHYWCGGFTIVELTVSLAIFLLLSSVVLAKYRTFDTNARFANAVEDVVLALRQAQVYGVGSKGNTTGCGVGSAFECSYGVYFPIAVGEKNKIISFVDSNDNHVYDVGEELPSGATVWQSSINIYMLNCSTCLFGNPIPEFYPLSITFKRPSPDAFITTQANALTSDDSANITLRDLNTGRESFVSINKAGQVSIN